jgi:colanic acid biosynthesis glycosyl transferase WcaI
LFPNWVETDVIYPLVEPSAMRAELGITADKIVALYSGNMGEKQGLEVVLEAARKIIDQRHIQFVLCGDGAARQRLTQAYNGLPNVLWISLQPLERLNDLLNMADTHLLPQRADAADLVMPSKLTGMLASGRPVVATAHPDTQVAEVVKTCGLITTPGDADELAQAVVLLANDAVLRKALGERAREYAVTNLERDAVLEKLEVDLRGCYRHV